MTDSGQSRQTTHNNHYVPRVYLKRWSTNGNTIWDYRLLVHSEKEPIWKRSQIKRTAVWPNLYTQVENGKADDSIESYLDRNYEQPVANILCKISNNSELSEKDMDDLVNFLIVQFARTPSMMAKMNEVVRRKFPSVVEGAVTQVEAELKASNRNCSFSSSDQGSAKTEPFPKLPFETKIHPDEGTIEVTLTAGRQSFLSAMGDLLNGKVAHTLRNHCWRVLETPNEIKLPTSDNPVAVFGISEHGEIDFGPGVGVPNANIIMPLDPTHLLFTEVGATHEQLLCFNPMQYHIGLFIRTIVLNASEHVYSLSRNDAIPAIRKREVDQHAAEELLRTRNEWRQNGAT